MPTRPQEHIFNARLALIALITAIVTVMVLVSAYYCIEFVLDARELVYIATS